jgi:hypothetical protein
VVPVAFRLELKRNSLASWKRAYLALPRTLFSVLFWVECLLLGKIQATSAGK